MRYIFIGDQFEALIAPFFGGLRIIGFEKYSSETSYSSFAHNFLCFV